MKLIAIVIGLVLTMPAVVYAASPVEKPPAKYSTKIKTETVPGSPTSAQEDTRLNKKITYSATEKQLGDIVKDIGKLSGVELKTASSAGEWQLRERKVNVFVKDMPLSKLMGTLARVTESVWTEASVTSKQPVYRLITDQKLIKAQEDKRAKKEEETKNLRSNTMDKLKKIGDLSDSDLEKLKSTDPVGYLMGKFGLAQMVGVMSEIPGLSGTFRDGNELKFPCSQLSPTQWNSLKSGMMKFYKLASVLNGEEIHRDNTDIPPGNVIISLNPNLSEMPDESKKLMLGFVSFQGEGIPAGTGAGFPIFNPDNAMIKFMATMVQKSIDTDTPMNKVMEQEQSNFGAEMRKNMISYLEHDDPELDHSKDPDDPDLHKKIKLSNDKVPMLPKDIQKEISESTGIALVVDSYEKQEFPNMSIKSDTELKDAVKSLSTGDIFRGFPVFFNWEKHDKTIELKDRDWYAKRLAMVPQAWIDRWTNTLVTTGTLDLNDLADICNLTQQQFQRNIMRDKIFSRSNLTGIWFGNRKLLKFYGSLNDAQKNAIFSESGLDLAWLTEPQWKLFNKLAVDFTPKPDIFYLLSATREQTDKSVSYSFKLRESTGSEKSQWNVVLPTYEGPEEESPTPDQSKTQGAVKQPSPKPEK